MLQSNVLVLVTKIGAQSARLVVPSTVQLPGTASWTKRSKPEPDKLPRNEGLAGLDTMVTCPSVSQPGRSASCVSLAKRNGTPLVSGFCTRRRSLYEPAPKPCPAWLQVQNAFVAAGRSEDNFQVVLQVLTSVLLLFNAANCTGQS